MFASIVGVLADVSTHQPQIITGVGQGGLVALMCTRPLLVEAACRARVITASEMYRIRSAWCAVVSIIQAKRSLL